MITDAFDFNALTRTVNFTVYLPDGYKNSVRRYLMAYLLEGAFSDEHERVKKGSVLETSDSSIISNRTPPSIAIL